MCSGTFSDSHHKTLSTLVAKTDSKLPAKDHFELHLPSAGVTGMYPQTAFRRYWE